MTKIIFKETIISIMLLVIVVLVLAIIFYDYVPTAKQVPSKVMAYNLEQEVKNELDETLNSDGQNIIRTYQISSSDLELYEDTDDYEKGRSNPFGDIATAISEGNSKTISDATNNIKDVETPKGYFNTSGK